MSEEPVEPVSAAIDHQQILSARTQTTFTLDPEDLQGRQIIVRSLPVGEQPRVEKTASAIIFCIPEPEEPDWEELLSWKDGA